MPGVLVRALERRSDTIERFTTKDWPGRSTGPGAPSTPTSASRLAVVLTCIRIYAEAVASLPLIAYRRLSNDDRERDPDFHLAELLQYEPNPEMSAVTFIETLTAHVVAWGNGYAEIVRDNGNRPIQLWPLHPGRMEVVRENERLIYRYTRTDGRRVDLTPEQTFHIPGLSVGTGVVGMSVLANQRAIELAQAAEDFGVSTWRNNARPGVVLSTEKKVDPDVIDTIVAQFERLKGPSNANKTLILPAGLTLNEIGIPPQEAQYVETRKFQRAEIIGMFLIPPHMAGDTERSTSWGAGIAEQNQKWLDLGLGMYLRRWEQTIRRSLIGKPWRTTHYVEFLRDALLRGDPLKRAQIQHLRWMDGVVNADQIRKQENMNALPDDKGKGYFVPVNMVPVEAAGEVTSTADRSMPIPDAMAALTAIAAANAPPLPEMTDA